MAKIKGFFDLNQRGREKNDILQDSTHFSVMILVHHLYKEGRSNAVNICENLFYCSNLKDITKGSEYQKVLRYIKRLEYKKLLKSSVDKKTRGRKKYYEINWSGIIDNFLLIMKDSPVYGSNPYEDLKKIKYHDNKYILAFIKLYFRGISTSIAFRFRISPISFKDFFMLLLTRILKIFGRFDAEPNSIEEALRHRTKYNKELLNFFRFINHLIKFEARYSPHSAVNGFKDYPYNYIMLKIKGDGFWKGDSLPGNDEETIDHLKSWYGELENIEESLDEIDNFLFPS